MDINECSNRRRTARREFNLPFGKPKPVIPALHGSFENAGPRTYWTPETPNWLMKRKSPAALTHRCSRQTGHVADFGPTPQRQARFRTNVFRNMGKHSGS